MANIALGGSDGSKDDERTATTGSRGVRDLDADVASGPDPQTGFVNIDATTADTDPGSEAVSNASLDPNATVSQVGGMLQFNRSFTVSDLAAGTGDPKFQRSTADGANSGGDGSSGGGDTVATGGTNPVAAFINQLLGSRNKRNTKTVGDGDSGGGSGLLTQIGVGIAASIGAFIVLDSLGKK